MYGFELNAGSVYIKYVGIVVYFVYFFILKQYRLTVNGSTSASTSATKLTDQINYLSSKYSSFGAAFKNMAHKITLTQRLAYLTASRLTSTDAITDRFSGPGKALDPACGVRVCVSVCVSEQ